MIPSGEQNLDGEPPWDGRGSAGPDGRGHNSARPVEEGAEDSLYEVVMFPESCSDRFAFASLPLRR
jgi:hypothetical protein